MSPVTMMGQLVGTICAICGVLMIGFTIPSLVNNFTQYYQFVDFVVGKEKLMMEFYEKEDERLEKEKKEKQLSC